MNFESTTLVKIDIRYDSNNKEERSILNKILDWKLKNNIFAVEGTFSAPNTRSQNAISSGFYTKDDALKLIHFLNDLKITGLDHE